MKRFLVLVFVPFVLIACGQKKEEKKELVHHVQPKGAQPGQKFEASLSKGYVEQGVQFLKEQNIYAAIQSFDNAIKHNPKGLKAYMLLGEVYMHMRDYKRAIDTFSAASRVAPGRGDIYYFLAICHGFVGDLEQAKLNAQKSVEVFRLANDEENLKRSAALLISFVNAQQPMDEEASDKVTDAAKSLEAPAE